jgi:hypothetical protein
MKVKLLVSRAGAGVAYSAGEEIEVSEAEAKRLMEAVPPQAIPVREAVAPERATRRAKKG